MSLTATTTTHLASNAAAGVASAGVAASLLDHNVLSISAAVIGAIVAYSFDDERPPKGAIGMMFGIFAAGFAAALVAAAVPAVPWLAWTGQIDIALRAGLFGLTIRFLIAQGKRLLAGWRHPPGRSPHGREDDL